MDALHAKICNAYRNLGPSSTKADLQNAKHLVIQWQHFFHQAQLVNIAATTLSDKLTTVVPRKTPLTPTSMPLACPFEDLASEFKSTLPTVDIITGTRTPPRTPSTPTSAKSF